MKKLNILFAILISGLSFAQCPEINLELSDPYNLILESSLEVDTITANGIVFNRVEVVKLGNSYAVYKSQSRVPLDLTNFKTGEEDDRCYYPEGEPMNTYNLNDEFPEGERYMVFNMSGDLIDKGITSDKTVQLLPRDKKFFLSVGEFEIKQLFLPKLNNI